MTVDTMDRIDDMTPKQATSVLGDVGAILIFNRQRLGLTQGQVARRARIALRTLQRYEEGTQLPNLLILRSLAKALELGSVRLLLPRGW